MTTEIRPEPSDSAGIVGDDLERALADAGVSEPNARALRGAVELIVLRLRAAVATKDDLAVLKDDLRREMDGLRREIDGLRREMRRTSFLMITVFGGLLIALLARTF